MRERGVIKWWDDRRKFGFIVKYSENSEVFFHVNDCDFEPVKDMEIEFEMGLDKSGRTKAINIKKVSVGSDGRKEKYSGSGERYF